MGAFASSSSSASKATRPIGGHLRASFGGDSQDKKEANKKQKTKSIQTFFSRQRFNKVKGKKLLCNVFKK